jgi:hypothetical protein
VVVQEAPRSLPPALGEEGGGAWDTRGVSHQAGARRAQEEALHGGVSVAASSTELLAVAAAAESEPPRWVGPAPMRAPPPGR